MTFINDILAKYRACNVLLRLMLWNLGVMVVLRLTWIVAQLCGAQMPDLLNWIGVPSQGELLLSRPWTPFTYMFAHFDLLHMIFNMLWLYWIGKIFLDYFNSKQLVALYVLGGLGGALFYVGGFALLPLHNSVSVPLIGASASVFGIALAMVMYAPNHKIRFFFFIEPFSLKWLVIVMLLIMILGNGNVQAGTHLCHLGGSMVGILFGGQMRRGHDITAWLNKCIDAIATMAGGLKKGPGKPVGGTRYGNQGATTSQAEPPRATSPSEDEIDAILAKLKRSGYGALTEQEKATLFRASRK